MYDTITTFEQAEEWHSNLDAEGLAYLKQVDGFVAKAPIDEKISLNKVVKPCNMEKFWMALSYVLLAIGRDVLINEDYSVIKIV